MDKRDLVLLEKAFAAEIDAALSKSGLCVMQTKATKRADALVSDGLLRKVKETLAGRYTVEGYALTEAGRLAYCLTCSA
jgi:acyl-CoA synthetase (AMP-forming)/AMP-acid ligase II